MTSNNARKRAARRRQAQKPGMRYVAAWEEVGAEHSLSRLNDELSTLISVFDTGLTEGGDAMLAASHANQGRFHPEVSARFGVDGFLEGLSIADAVLRSPSYGALSALIARVIQQTADEVAAAHHAAIAALLPGASPEDSVEDPVVTPVTFTEASRDGALKLAVDEGGRLLWCEIGPPGSGGEWSGQLLGWRLTALHRSAEMRALLHGYLGAVGSGDLPVPEGIPNAAALGRFRSEHLVF